MLGDGLTWRDSLERWAEMMQLIRGLSNRELEIALTQVKALAELG